MHAFSRPTRPLTGRTVRSLRVESLEDRRVLTSAWQAQPNAFDVDGSGFVEPLDVLLIVNDINSEGIRELAAELPSGYDGPLFDINGDQFLGPLDVLQVVNVINAFPNPPELLVELSASSDRNGDHVLLGTSAFFSGSFVNEGELKVQILEGESVASEQQITTDQQAFQLNLAIDQAVNHIRFVFTDVRGREVATERLIRQGDVITAWNAAMLEAVRENTNELSTGILQKPPPPVVAKYLAMMHGAMFDAINAVTQTHEAYAYQGTSDDASTVAAAASAAYEVAKHVYPATESAPLWETTLSEVLDTLPDSSEKLAGIELGQQAAQAMISRRLNDGSELTSDYSPTTGPGNWKPTPPDFTEATVPHWVDVEPFAIESGDQFRPTQPPELTTVEYANSVDEVFRIGSADSSERTADQTEIAHFWEDAGGTATPPGHWNQIAADVAASAELSLIEHARLFALLNYALADAGISAWDAKYHYDYWRPIDAIREANSDANLGTVQDTDWTPLLPTPAFPTYTSGHSTFSGAAASVLSNVLGLVSFSSMADPGITGQWPPAADVSHLPIRTFDSFWGAAQEAGISRIYGGIHFDFDNSAGLAAGGQLGQWVFDNLLQPVS